MAFSRYPLSKSYRFKSFDRILKIVNSQAKTNLNWFINVTDKLSLNLAAPSPHLNTTGCSPEQENVPRMIGLFPWDVTAMTFVSSLTLIKLVAKWRRENSLKSKKMGWEGELKPYRRSGWWNWALPAEFWEILSNQGRRRTCGDGLMRKKLCLERLELSFVCDVINIEWEFDG